MKQFKTESKRILDLMINSIYTNKEIFLRELISNASDAIDKLKFISLTDTSVNSDFKIVIPPDEAARTLTIEDNGIGMTEADLEKNLGTIAESGTLAFKKENEGKTDNELIGQFGVGFYSAFMVADKIEVYTRAYKSDKAYKWESEGAEGYSVTETDKDTVGTKIVLTLKQDTDDFKYSDFLKEYKISYLVKTYSDYIRYPIETEVTRSERKPGSPDDKPEYEDVKKTETLNSMVLKLYSNGVMIMDKCEDLLPDYFGFVKGIVDSSDLSLNISREILQQDRQVKAIANSIEKKISSELKKMMEEDRENYEKLFKEFGLAIKFGVYAGFGMNKDKLKDFLMFYSSKKEKLVSLKEYVDGMAEGQNEIYFACGESYEKIAKLPQIEKAKEKGYEILFFKDGVDEFVARILGDYDGKKFKSVSEADFSLDTDAEKEALKEKSESHKDLLEEIKNDLGDRIKEVRLTSNLKTYPVCLISGGDVSIEMEKVFAGMPNSEGKVKAEKILEISAEHKILDKLQSLYDTDKETLKKYAVVLYGQARMLEGLSLDDVGEFVSSLSDIIE